MLANAEWQAVGYLLGVTEVLPTAREHQVIGHLGPDLLGPGWDAAQAAEAVRRLTATPAARSARRCSTSGTSPVSGLSTWQKRCSCAGSIRRGRQATVEDLTALVELGHRLLDANKERLGHVTTGDARPGRESWVYGRAGRPCRRCGTLIRRGEQGTPGQERLRFWCPNCQR